MAIGQKADLAEWNKFFGGTICRFRAPWKVTMKYMLSVLLYLYVPVE